MRGNQGSLTAMGVVLGMLLGSTTLVLGAPFRDVPPTIGAYTLRGGEWQIAGEIGLRPFPLSYSAAGLSVAYGLASWLQMGIALGHGVAAEPGAAYVTFAASARPRVPLGTQLDLGIPLEIWFQDFGFGVLFGGVHSDLTLSVRLGHGLALHGSILVGFGRHRYGFYYSPHASVDLDLLPNLKLVANLGLIPVTLSLDVWLRPVPFLDVKLALAPLALSITGGVYLRF